MITAFGVRPGYRQGMVGPHLAAAVCDEAARLGVGAIWSLAEHPAVATALRHLGFRVAPRGCRLLVA